MKQGTLPIAGEVGAAAGYLVGGVFMLYVVPEVWDSIYGFDSSKRIFDYHTHRSTEKPKKSEYFSAITLGGAVTSCIYLIYGLVKGS